MSKGPILAKNAYFLQKMLTSAKLRVPWYYKVSFLKLHMGVYLRAEFQDSSIILDIVLDRVNFKSYPPPHPPSTRKSPPRIGLKRDQCHELLKVQEIRVISNKVVIVLLLRTLFS